MSWLAYIGALAILFCLGYYWAAVIMTIGDMICKHYHLKGSKLYYVLWLTVAVVVVVGCCTIGGGFSKLGVGG